ncbi:MAG: SPASM domain-containing protein [Treponema sp.]|jgi:uncharacterized protein|nr:SPASM domain-containing protein [Treponema sp.]
MKRLSLLIKPASSLCNMRCRYCFYADVGAHRALPSYGLMGGETARRIIDNTFKDLEGGDELTFAFQGGEPALAGLDWFKDFAAYTAEARERRGDIQVHYAFQTNGLALDRGWAEFFRNNKVLVGLSLDGPRGFHDKNRLDAGGGGTWDAVMEAKGLLDREQVDYNILCVLTNELAQESEKVWAFIQREKIRYIQFIPCLEGFGEEGEGLGGGRVRGPGLRPPRFARFYSRLFSLWLRELERGRYVSVKLFDDTANYFFKGIPSSCGIDGRCSPQFVVEADGGVYPCDFYVLDSYRTGNLSLQSPREIFDSPLTGAFLGEGQGEGTPCGTCTYRTLCRGGCKRMRKAMYYGPGGTFCGYGDFLDKCLDRLGEALRKYF